MVEINEKQLESIFKDHEVKITKSDNAINFSFAKAGEDNTKIFVCSNGNTLFYSGGFGTFVFRLGGSDVKVIEHFKTKDLRLDYWAEKIICSETKAYTTNFNTNITELKRLICLEFDGAEKEVKLSHLKEVITLAKINCVQGTEVIFEVLNELNVFTGWVDVLDQFDVIYTNSTNYLICIYVLNKLAKMEEN